MKKRKSIRKPAEKPSREKGGEQGLTEQRNLLKRVGVINPERLEEYLAYDGYAGLKKALLAMKPAEVIEEVKRSELRGRGGAGFPTGLKWSFAAKAPGTDKYVICNADEGEPGTFKDRAIMEGDPHRIVEGMAIAGYAIGATRGYVYIRGEYAESIRRLQKAINDAKRAGFLGQDILSSGASFDLTIYKGAGSYECGEETALMDSLEGKRGEPRRKPPYPPSSGLWKKPTIINNVETLANIPDIIARGAEWFKAVGVEGSRGTKLFCLMGDLNRRGLVELPFGVPLSGIVQQFGGGIKGGQKPKAVILGGVSGFLITPEEWDVPVDFNSLAKLEAGPGSGSIIALSKSRCIVDVVKNIAEFFLHESCGKCIPCLRGTEQVWRIVRDVSLGQAAEKDLMTLDDLAKTMFLTSFCPMGQTAPSVLTQSLKKFEKEWRAHLQAGTCPSRVCS